MSDRTLLGERRESDSGKTKVEGSEIPPWPAHSPKRSSSGSCQRVTQACNTCRIRKIKCNGARPCCQPCQTRQLHCQYRLKSRVRQNTAYYTMRRGSWVCKSSLNDNIAGNIFATDRISSGYPVQLFYGPSSNFSLLQQIYHQLSAPPPPVSTTSATAAGETMVSTKSTAVDPAENGLDFFCYRGLFFGRYSTSPETVGATSPVTSDDRVLIYCSALRTMLLYSSAMKFVDQFIKSELPFVSFIDVLALRHSVEMIFRNLGKPSSLSEYIKIISCLALGATMTEQTVWAERLFTQCQELCAEFVDVVNLDMVQITFIMAQFQMQAGHPNSAYLLTGRAIRKAIAAGFHREMPLGSNIPLKFIEQRRRTFWSLCIFEYIICFSLGRPHSISEERIHILLPDNRFIIIMARLIGIICRAGQLLYGSQQGSMKSRWIASQEIQLAFRQFESSLPKTFQFEDPDTSSPGCQSVAQFLLGSVYYHTMLLQFRPFLISHTFRQNSHDIAASVTRSSDNDNQDASSWLQESSANAAETARKLIRFMSTAYASLPITKSLRFNGLYIDAAGFVLILNMLRSVDPEAEDLLLVRHGLDCLSQMLPDKWAALSHSVFAIKRMLALLDQKRKSEIRLSPGLVPNLSNDLEGGDGAVTWLEIQAEFDRLRESTYEALRWDVTNSLF